MNQKKMTVIAVACGIACAVCVALFMVSVQGEADAARNEALARYGGEQVEALVATRDIVAGERVDFSSVETKMWIADLLPEHAIRTSADAVGKTLTSTIFKGEVITEGRFDSEHSSIDVPTGKQAVSVPAKAVQAVGGVIQAGMSIDVYSSGDTTTTLIAHDVNVLDSSVGNAGVLTSGSNGWITLAVDPEQVQEVIAASNKTTLYFTLPGKKPEEDNETASGKTTAKTNSEQNSDSSSTNKSKNASSTSSLSSGKAEGGDIS